jgi:ZIP family zinc transporter
MIPNVGMALILTTLAGLSTAIGGLMGVATRREPGPRFMTLTLGFAAGVMVMVSFVELLPGGIEAIGFGAAYLAFFGGMFIMFLIDALIPHTYMAEQPHDTYMAERPHAGRRRRRGRRQRLLKTGLFVALGIGIHNFPEGMATFAGTLKDVDLGMAIAVAIALHNIPEGLAVSAPVYAATGSRGQAFLWSLLAGLAEPVGAALAALFLLPFLTDALLGWLLSAVAGIMIFISLDELVPAAHAFGEEHLAITGVILGMIVMVVSLLLLR